MKCFKISKVIVKNVNKFIVNECDTIFKHHTLQFLQSITLFPNPLVWLGEYRF